MNTFTPEERAAVSQKFREAHANNLLELHRLICQKQQIAIADADASQAGILQGMKDRVGTLLKREHMGAACG